MVVKLTIDTTERMCFVDIIPMIIAKVEEKKWKEGILTIFCPHTTAAISINENSDPAVRKDIVSYLSKLVPYNSRYSHFEGNSDAHIKSSMIGCSLTIIIQNSMPLLGQWQDIFFCEFDGPRKRNVFLKFIDG